MQAEYDGRQIVGIDLHRRRTVIVRMTEAGDQLGCVRIDNDPLTLAAEIAKAKRLDKRSEAAAHTAEHAGETSTEYIFATVFFAAVLFFAGISMRFRWVPMRIGVLILSAAVLLYGISRLVDLPRL